MPQKPLFCATSGKYRQRYRVHVLFSCRNGAKSWLSHDPSSYETFKWFRTFDFIVSAPKIMFSDNFYKENLHFAFTSTVTPSFPASDVCCILDILGSARVINKRPKACYFVAQKASCGTKREVFASEELYSLVDLAIRYIVRFCTVLYCTVMLQIFKLFWYLFLTLNNILALIKVAPWYFTTLYIYSSIFIASKLNPRMARSKHFAHVNDESHLREYASTTTVHGTFEIVNGETTVIGVFWGICLPGRVL